MFRLKQDVSTKFVSKTPLVNTPRAGFIAFPITVHSLGGDLGRRRIILTSNVISWLISVNL